MFTNGRSFWAGLGGFLQGLLKVVDYGLWAGIEAFLQVLLKVGTCGLWAEIEAFLQCLLMVEALNRDRAISTRFTKGHRLRPLSRDWSRDFYRSIAASTRDFGLPRQDCGTEDLPGISSGFMYWQDNLKSCYQYFLPPLHGWNIADTALNQYFS